MSDSALTVFVIFIAAILMFVFPLMAMSDKTDDMSQVKLQTEITNFTNNARKKRVITQIDYDQLVETVNNPNVYDIEITVNRLDENPAKKANGETITIGDNIYYVMYTTQVLESLPLELNEGDIITVTAKNKNTTLFDNLKSAVYKITKNESATITAQSSGLVN